jgi:tetratricopeptide (TPR) repeat protein
VFVISAIMLGLFAPPIAPRTSAERDLMTLGATVQSGQADSQTYAQYIGVLISAGQLSKAQQALNEVLRTAKRDRSYLLAQQAQLNLAEKDYKGTVTAANKAMVEAEKELKAYMEKNVANNRVATAGAVMPDSFTDAALYKAEALMATKKYAAAIKAFDVYIKEHATDSDILVARALAKIKTGDKKGAETDLRGALKYVPDFQPALDGLKQIGAAR